MCATMSKPLGWSKSIISFHFSGGKFVPRQIRVAGPGFLRKTEDCDPIFSAVRAVFSSPSASYAVLACAKFASLKSSLQSLSLSSWLDSCR